MIVYFSGFTGRSGYRIDQVKNTFKVIIRKI
jgi:hypothetical protein